MGEIAEKNNQIIADIDVEQLGIEAKRALNIQSSFLPKFEEYKGYQEVYAGLIKQEITPELCEEANTLKNKLVKVRTGIDKIHKTEKRYYLAAGRFIDALKNKLQEPGIQMEENLKEIADHYKIKEQQRLEKLQKDREELLSKYVEEVEGRDLCSMEDDVWEAYLEVQKKRHEERIEVCRKEREGEEKRARLVALNEERKEKLIPYWGLLKEGQQSSNFGVMKEDEFKALLKSVKAEKKKDDDHKKELEKEAKALRKEKEKRRELSLSRSEELGKAKRFVESTKELGDMTSAEYKKVSDSANKKYEEHRANQKRLRELEEAEAKKAEQEKKRLEEEVALKNKSENEQLSSWVNSFEIEESPVENDVAELITSKFEAFKKWSIGQMK
jgi:hypothetical protein